MKITYEKGVLKIEVPYTEEIRKAAPLSNSGKTKMIAGTGGFSKVDGAPGGLKIGLNVIADKD